MSTTLPSKDEKNLDITQLEHSLPAADAVARMTDGEKTDLAEAQEQHEKDLSLWQNLVLYKRAVLWSVVMSASLIMEGFDKALIGNLWALPAFAQRYGVYIPATNQYTVEASWQTGISQASTVGSFLGLLVAGYIVDRIGYRLTMLYSMMSMIPFVLIVTLAPNQVALMIGQLLCGFPWGIFAALAPAYSSEICPIGLRPYTTTYNNLCWVIGQFIAAGTMLGMTTLPGEWGYRLPFSLQLVWPLVLIPLYYFCPESPWHLVRKGRLDEAAAVLDRIYDPSVRGDTQAAVAAMVRTNNLELQMAKGEQPRWKDCFRGVDLRRTEISALAWASQVIAGGSFVIGYVTFFFRQAGLGVQDAFKMGLGVTACAFVGTCLSWFMIYRYSRRTIFVGGLFGLASIHLIVAGLSFGGTTATRWALCSLMLIWVMLYDFTVGPLAYAIVGEASSTRLRAKTVALSRNAYYIAAIVNNVVVPYMLNPQAGNLGAKTNFVFGPLAAIMAVWAYFRLPEMKDRSFYELDVMFEKGVSARHFSKTVVETDADGVAHIRRK